VLGVFVRYLDPLFADAHFLRLRAGRHLPPVVRPVARLERLPASIVGPLVRFFLAVERATPPSRTLDEFVAERRPDVVVAAPYVFFRGAQVDLLASARRAGAATVAAIASWDNLTTKALLRGDPDRVLVWNEAQVREAEELHRVPRERVVATGAPTFDKWFERQPRRPAAEFAEHVGLPPGRPHLLFVGSTAAISAPRAEQEFVRRWLAAIRASGNPALAELPVLVRPHPYNSLHWDDADLSEFAPVAIWPPAGANPVDADDRADYFDSIHHAAAVVGINTSAMIEAAIVGRPVLTVTSPDFSDTQSGTVHFRHLLPENGGFVRRAASIERHLMQLEEAIDDPAAHRLDAFVASFVRPWGRDVPSTPLVADAIEAAAAAGPTPVPAPAAWTHVAIRLFSLLDLVDSFVSRERLAGRLRGRGTSDRLRLERAAARIERAAPDAASIAVRRLGVHWDGRLRTLARRIDPPRPAVTRESYGRRQLAGRPGRDATTVEHER
jgi:hypothetical protein